jgi:hypothetical protein
MRTSLLLSRRWILPKLLESEARAFVNLDDPHIPFESPEHALIRLKGLFKRATWRDYIEKWYLGLHFMYSILDQQAMN